MFTFQTLSCPPAGDCRWWGGWRAPPASSPRSAPGTAPSSSPSRCRWAAPTSWWPRCTRGAGCWPGSATSPSSARRTPRSRWRSTGSTCPWPHSSPRASSRSSPRTRAPWTWCNNVATKSLQTELFLLSWSRKICSHWVCVSLVNSLFGNRYIFI